jgi:hypothetical protein
MIIGWREWLALPGLGIPALKAKVDTGARTSALHAFDLETFTTNGVRKARFAIHPLQRRTDPTLHCVAEVIDQRVVSDSGGHREKRWVIATGLSLSGRIWTAEITLTGRDNMLFRMLLGRTALAAAGLIVNPKQSYVCGKVLSRSYFRDPKDSL